MNTLRNRRHEFHSIYDSDARFSYSVRAQKTVIFERIKSKHEVNASMFGSFLSLLRCAINPFQMIKQTLTMFTNDLFFFFEKESHRDYFFILGDLIRMYVCVCVWLTDLLWVLSGLERFFFVFHERSYKCVCECGRNMSTYRYYKSYWTSWINGLSAKLASSSGQ